MTYHLTPIGKAMTGITAVIAFSSTPAFAQEAGAPPEAVADTTVQTPATADPLAPELTADQAPTTETAVPAAPKPKVETTRTPRARASSSSSPARPTARRASAAAPAAAPAATAAVAPAAQVAEPAPPPAAPPPVTAEPAAPPAAEPATTSDTAGEMMAELMENGALPIGAGALGLLGLGGTAIAMRRRRRRREDEEFAERQRLLDAADARAETEAAPGPAFARPAPMHDPVPGRSTPATERPEPAMVAGPSIPSKGNWESRPDSDFLFRRADKAATEPTEPAR